MLDRSLTTFAALLTGLAHMASVLGPPPEPPTAHASVRGAVIHVAGRPFFPIMLIDQCGPGAAGRAHRLGVNLILDESCTTPGATRRMLSVLPIKDRSTRGNGLVGWSYPDEPDDNGWTPESLARAHPYARGNPDGLLTFLTTSSGFFRAPYRRTGTPAADYGRFARLADVAGFDLYPLDRCDSDLSTVYDAQRRFAHLAGDTPTFQWIETGPIRPTYCGGFTMTPAELRAEVWLAITGGARGIGYFTHTWTPQPHEFDVRPELRQTMVGIDRSLAALAPGLLGRTLLSGANSPAIKTLARSGGPGVYVFTVNSMRVPVKAQVNVPALRPGPLAVYGERREVTVAAGRFVDIFQPLAVHVYVQRAGP